jgi:serine/threonine-protein kinase HipA
VNLNVYAEVKGQSLLVGVIDTQPGYGEGFTYSSEWITKGYPAISVSLPITEERYSARKMRPYFDGLLPEGTIRARVASDLHVTQAAYTKILAGIGWECIGAVSFGNPEDKPSCAYEKLDQAALEQLTHQTSERGAAFTEDARFSIAGAQPKTSLYLGKDGAWYRPIGGAPSTHILKPVSSRYADAALNEVLCTKTAAKLGLNVPETMVIHAGVPCVCTKRFDRWFANDSVNIELASGQPMPYRLHHEDTSQALGIVPEHKYEEEPSGYLKKIATLVRDVSGNPGADLIQLYKSIVFNLLIGNCDAHLKNYALLMNEEWNELRLAPFYDLVSTACYPGLSMDTAFYIGGQHHIDEINRDNLNLAAAEIQISKGRAAAEISNIIDGFEASLQESAHELVDEGIKDALIMQQRILEQAAPRLERLGRN